MNTGVYSKVESGNQKDGVRLPQDGKRYLQFGDYCLDRHRQEVFKNGARTKLQGKTFQVLLTLLERAGEVVTREELRARLWPSDTHVNFDANVNTTVNKLRQALGDSTDQPVYIETIPRKGYSFVAPVESTDRPAPPPVRRPAAVRHRQDGQEDERDSIAKPRDRATRLTASWSRSTWMTVGIAALVVAGILFGAGLATFWIGHMTRFSPLH